MKNVILSLEQMVVKVSCGNENATGFFLKETVLLTAFHALDGNKDGIPIVIHYNDVHIEASIISVEKTLDIALLQIEQSLDVRLFPLEALNLRLGEEWETFGFPYREKNIGFRFSGTVHQIESNTRWDYLLNCSSVQSEYDYGGLSGSPIVASNKICAITLVQQSNKLGCISIKKIEKFLKENGIEVNQPFDNIAIPDGLKREVMDSNPNFAVFDHIDTMLEENTGWILLNGSPGCGKTTISATYVPDNDIYYVVGRYFLKVPQDNLSATIRGSKRNFLEWIEELVYRTIGETLPAQKNWEEKEKDVPNLLNQLSSCIPETPNKGSLGFIS